MNGADAVRRKHAESGSSTQRDIRNLSQLGDTASTSRVLNLAQISITSSKDPDYRRKPFFRNMQMNKAIVIKHTLRANERECFAVSKRTATKIILPFDSKDLKLGGQSIFVGQIGFDAFIRSFYNTTESAAVDDVAVLRALDELPSLDPLSGARTPWAKRLQAGPMLSAEIAGRRAENARFRQ